ncbi:MAG: hypothetical protein QW057_09230 [Candidatus Bathyarchaeia archaeon]
MADSGLISEIKTVGVTVLIVMVVSLWVTGTISSFMFVQKPIVHMYADTDLETGHPKIIASVKNAGSRPLTIDEVTVTTGNERGIPILKVVSTLNGEALTEPLPLRIPVGGIATVTLTLSGNTPRQSIEVRLHTTLGAEVIQYVQLP